MGHLPKVIASYLSHLIDMKTNLSKGYFCLFVSCAGYLFETKKNQIFFFGQKLDSETSTFSGFLEKGMPDWQPRSSTRDH